jgi:HAE1 family hydrophobic/amphiphilic exporter-1
MSNAITGYSMLTQTYATYTGLFFVSLDPWHERHGEAASVKGIVADLNRRFSTIPEARVFAFLPPAIPGFGTASGFNFMLQDRSGGSVEYLAENAERFLDAARQRPELAGLNSSLRASVPQIFARIDRDKALKQGVDVRDVYGTLQALMGGVYVNDFNRFGRQWKVYLQADPAYRVSEDQIGRFFVRNAAGGMVPLSTLFMPEPISGPEFTTRFNLFRSAEIVGTPAPGYSSGQAMAALEEVAAEVLPQGIGYDWNSMSFQEKRSQGGAAGVFLMSLLFVFLVLAAQYESWTLPFSVLLGTPIAVFGAFLGLWMRGFDNDVYAQIGLVMLIGLAAKNSILIVEFAKMEHESGKGLVDAALSGARLRLRPILMTSFAFILGCVPLYIASGAGAVSRQVLGTVVVVGMLAATLIGIFITPVLFVVIERLTGGGGKHATEDAPAPAAEKAHA